MKVVAGLRMTGFNDSVSYPDLVVQPDAEAAGLGGGCTGRSRSQPRNIAHARHSAAFSAAIVDAVASERSTFKLRKPAASHISSGSSG